MKIKLIVRWYDLWIGIYADRKNKEVYVFFIPCIGFKITFKKKGKNHYPIQWDHALSNSTDFCVEGKIVKKEGNIIKEVKLTGISLVPKRK